MANRFYICVGCYFLLLVNFVQPEVTWDESVYVGLGKYLWSGGASGIYEPFRPILLPIVLGALWRLGIDPIIAGKLLVALCAALAVVIVYKIGKLYYDELTAVAAAVVVAVMPVCVVQSVLLYTEVVATLFTLIAVLMFLRLRAASFGLFSGLAFLTRFPSAVVFFVCAAVALAFGRVRFMLLAAAVFCVVIAPYFVKNLFFGSGWLDPFIAAMRHQGNTVFSEPWHFYLTQLLWNSPLLLAFPAGALMLVKRRRGESGVVALLLASVVPLAYFTLITNKQPRFMVSFLPFVVLVAAAAVDLSKTWQKVVVGLGVSLSLVLAVVKARENYYGYIPTDELCAGQIITSVPMYAAYYDNLFIPAYFDPGDAIERFQKHEAESCMFIFMDVFPCEQMRVPDCATNSAKLRELFESHPPIVRHRVTIYGR